MSFSLDQDQIETFERDGYLTPLRVFDDKEVSELRRHFEAFEQNAGEHAAGLRTDLHLVLKWAWNVVTDPRVVDPVVSLLGPDVLLWSMNWFIKEPRDGKFVSLHQDANYWGLYPHDVLTAWIALSDASAATGPMRFLPGSHKGELYDHDNTYAEDNLLTRGQTVQAPVSDTDCTLAPLRSGEMSLHHVRLIHGSGPNETDDRRIGMVLRFCGAHVEQTKGSDTAVLIAGEDRFGHFELLPPPGEDFGEVESARHVDAVTRMAKLIMMD